MEIHWTIRGIHFSIYDLLFFSYELIGLLENSNQDEDDNITSSCYIRSMDMLIIDPKAAKKSKMSTSIICFEVVLHVPGYLYGLMHYDGQTVMVPPARKQWTTTKNNQIKD